MEKARKLREINRLVQVAQSVSGGAGNQTQLCVMAESPLRGATHFPLGGVRLLPRWQRKLDEMETAQACCDGNDG